MKIQISPTSVIDYDDLGRGKPLVFVHGFPFSRAMWRPQVDAFKAAYRVMVPDLRGFGGTSSFDSWPSIEQMADDVNALLEEVPVAEPIVLCGLSMGGYVALAFARKYSQRLGGLILADTRAEADNAEGKANREKMIAFAESHTPGDVLEQMLGKLVNAETLSRRPEVLQEIRSIAAAQSTSSIVEALQAMRDRPDASPFLAAINVPALVIVGKDDALTPPSMGQSLAAGIKGARLEVIPGAGHLSNLEQPELFNRAVDSFLKTL